MYLIIISMIATMGLHIGDPDLVLFDSRALGPWASCSVIFLNEDCRRHYQEIHVDSPGEQLSLTHSEYIVPRACHGKLLTQSPEG